MKRRSKYSSRLGKLFFILPVLIIGGLVVYAFFELSSPGTLIVTAESSDCPQGNCPQLSVSASVNGKSGETPWTLPITQGNYIVNFTTLQWYNPPTSRDVSVLPGQTVYAVAVYEPIGKVIRVTPSGFNATIVTALHGVTPVNWTNPTSTQVTFIGSPFSRVSLPPGQTFSYIFPTAGTYEYAILSTNDTVTIDVS